LLSGCNPFSHSHLSGNLWYAYLGSILSNPCVVWFCASYLKIFWRDQS
jgi:hypothetical protein